MKRKILSTITVRSFARVILLGAAWQAQAQDAKASYPTMTPLAQYLIADRNAEIALARTAAPESISGDAEVLVLGRHG
jgi:predicted outer membrane protein